VEIFDGLSGSKESEARLEVSRTLAALSEMAASVAHQIRNPLGGIGGFAALLERDPALGEAQRRMAHKIIEGVASLDRIITELLMFTRPLRPSLQTIDVRRGFLEIVESQKRRWQESGLEIRTRLDLASEPIAAQLDPQLFHEMAWYLLDDAAMATAGGELHISLSRLQNSRDFAIQVQDPARVLMEEERSRLFYPFYTPQGSGVGLSLAIVRRIVERHHGEVTVRSEPSIGTVYRVVLPALDEQKSA
jgi:signal transduction histidine kinase